MKMYHATTPANARDILASGLKAGTEESAYTDEHAAWADQFYGIRPIFLSVQKGKYAGIPLLVDVSGPELVADLAGLADLGDQPPYMEDGEMVWEDGIGPPELSSISSDGAISIADLLAPGSESVKAAIAATGTAAVLQDIPSERIKIARYDESMQCSASLLREFIQSLVKHGLKP
jgi:hypothetical protein